MLDRSQIDIETVIVGPTHPYSGGIAQHTTRLALEIENRGRAVAVESWRNQYPSFLYKGSGTVPRDSPEIGVPSIVIENLAWFSPLSWWKAGRRLSKVGTAVLNVPTPFHVFPYLVMLLAAGNSVRNVGIIHNPVPHERFPGDKALMGVLLRRLDQIIVHSAEAAATVASSGVSGKKVRVAELPSPWHASRISAKSQHPPNAKTPVRALFFGTIRSYKGLDLLLQAMANANSMTLTIAGEFWQDEEHYRQLATTLRIIDRVTFRSGYVPAAELPDVFQAADVLVLPYRSATSSIVRELGFDFGLPVIATSVGSLAEGITHNVNGLVIEPNNKVALSEALLLAEDRKNLNHWSSKARELQANRSLLWSKYLDAVFSN